MKRAKVEEIVRQVLAGTSGSRFGEWPEMDINGSTPDRDLLAGRDADAALRAMESVVHRLGPAITCATDDRG